MHTTLRRCPLCKREFDPGQFHCACGVSIRRPGEKPQFEVGALLPWIPFIGFVLLVFWISRLGPLEHPMTMLIKTVAITIISCTTLALLDADRVSGKSWPYVRCPLSELPSAGWFIFLLLAWPLAFPVFLYVHYFHARRKRMLFGWTNTALFVLAFLVVWAVISHRSARPWPEQFTAAPASKPRTIPTLPPPSRVDPSVALAPPPLPEVITPNPPPVYEDVAVGATSESVVQLGAVPQPHVATPKATFPKATPVQPANRVSAFSKVPRKGRP